MERKGKVRSSEKKEMVESWEDSIEEIQTGECEGWAQDGKEREKKEVQQIQSQYKETNSNIKI